MGVNNFIYFLPVKRVSRFLAILWKCVLVGLRRFKEERKCVHSIICIRCCSVRVPDVCSEVRPKSSKRLKK